MSHSPGAYAHLEGPCLLQPLPIYSPHDGALQQGPDCLVVMANGDTAQGIGHPMIYSPLVFQHELK